MPNSTKSSRTVRRLAPLAVGLAALAAPGAAQAGTLTLSGPDLTYVASPGEANGVFYTRDAGATDSITIGDFGADVLTGDPRCAASNGSVRCEGVTGRIRIELGDGSDSASQPSGETIGNPVEIHGGPGNDKLSSPNRGTAASALFGDDGADTLVGDDQAEELRGGPGDDALNGNGGADALYGEDGNDTLDGDDPNLGPVADVLDGGAGVDRVAGWTAPQRDRNVPIRVTVDGVADDGRPGEGDNVTGVERQTSNVSGTFAYTDADDVLDVYANVDLGPSSVSTRGGADRVTGGNADETIDAGAGDDRIDAGYGSDTITGGPGRDVIFADKATPDCGLFESCSAPQGNDTIHARDGEADSIDCGVGTDRAVVDAVDTVAANCETIERPGGGGGGQTGQAGQAGGKGNGGGSSVDAKGRPKVRLALQARRRGARVVVSGKVAKALKGTKVTLRLTSRGRTVSRTTVKVGRAGRFSARLRTKGKRRLVLRTTIAATRTTAATTRTAGVR